MSLVRIHLLTLESLSERQKATVTHLGTQTLAATIWGSLFYQKAMGIDKAQCGFFLLAYSCWRITHQPVGSTRPCSPQATQPAMQGHAQPTSGLAATTWGRSWQSAGLGVSPAYQHSHRIHPCHNKAAHSAHKTDTPRIYNSVDQRECVAGPYRIFCTKFHLSSDQKIYNCPIEYTGINGEWYKE